MKARFLALAALVLGLASCQTEHEGLNVNVGGEQETYVTVSLPETTRANSALGAFDNVVASDKYTIRYIFQVFYDSDESQAARQVIYTDENRVSFPVRLVPGRHYNFVVWADVTTTEGKTLNTIHNLAKTDAAAADIHYNTLDLKDVRIIDNQWVAMDETRDAFTGQFNTAVDGDQTAYNSAKSINFTLTRPFAKLRVITTDMEQLNDLNIIPTRATVEYTTEHYASFNAFAGGVNENVKMSKTHTNFAIKAYDDNAYDKSKVLFTDYFFAKDDQDVVNFTLTVYDQRCTEQDVQDDYIIKTNNFNTPIPAHRNNLTTISGNTLTEGNNITVEVTKDFENTPNPGDAPYYQETISSDVELLAALAKLQEPGANYKYIVIAPLTVDYSLISTLAATRAASTTLGSVTINLNGFTVTFVSNGNEPVITLPAGSELTLVNDSNDGGIIVTGEGTGAAIQNNGSLNIEGVALQSESNGAVIENNNVANIEDSTLNEGALVNNENGQANIEGSTLNEGSVENNGQADFTNSTLNEGSVENNGQAEFNESTLNEGSVQNNGEANFNGGNVDDNAVENGEDAVVGSYSAEDLQRAINNAKAGEPNVFTLKGDVTGDITVSQQEGIDITIDGADFKFDGTIYVYGGSRDKGAETLTIKNVNFKSTIKKDFIWSDNAQDSTMRYAHNVTIENCTFTGVEGETIVGIRLRQAYDITIKRCTATNMHSLVQNASNYGIVIEDVEISALSGINFTNAVQGATIKNCNITATEADGYGIRVDATGANTVTVSGCTINAFQPIVLRSAVADFTLNLEGNTLTPSDKYHIYIKDGVLPTLNGADDLIVYPRDVVSSWDEFTAALAANRKNIVLTEDITYSGNYSLQKAVTIDLNGKSITMPMFYVFSTATIKNGTINGKMYARSGCNATLDGLTFSGTISDDLSTEGHLAIQGGCDVYAKDCVFAATTVNGTQTRSLSIEGRSSGALKFENCNFKFVSWGSGAGKYKKQVYVNYLSGTASLDFTNCNFNGKATNIQLASSFVWSNLNLTGCSGGFTLEISRDSTSLTEEELTIYRAIKTNNSGSKRFIFSDGEKNNL